MSWEAQQKDKDECWTTQDKARIPCCYTQLHRWKTPKWKSVQGTGGFCNVWKKAKKVLPLTSLMGTKDLQGCWSTNWVSIVTGSSSLIYSPSTNELKKGQLQKVRFPQGFFLTSFNFLHQLSQHEISWAVLYKCPELQCICTRVPLRSSPSTRRAGSEQL